MKKILFSLGSMKTMAVLMLIFALSIGYATFIENDYGTVTAKADVYNARWFEILLGLLSINLIFNIYRYKMFSIKKAPIFIFHIAFIIILFGAGITRYIGYEGTMHIREGASSSIMTSSDTYFKVVAKIDNKSVVDSKKSYLSKRMINTLSSSLNIADKHINVNLVEYIPDAIETIVESKEGKAIIKMMVTSSGSGTPVTLRDGEFYENEQFVLDFNSKKEFNKDVIKIFIKDGKLFMKHSKTFSFLKMDDGSKGILEAKENEPLVRRTLFSFDDSGFVLRKFLAHATTKVISNPNASPMIAGFDALRFNIKVNDISKTVLIYGEVGSIAKDYHYIVDGVDIQLSYGAISLQLPFSIYLKDFQLDRYPGSMSPASYASEVVLIDKEQEIKKPYRIFMNHILEHRGFRFFQASYDRDEKGTILSVNNDPGTLPSYIGYFLLAVGMLWSLFSRKNRFEQLKQRAKKANENQTIGLLLVVGLLSSVVPTYSDELDIKTLLAFDKQHAEKFGQLVVQDSGGRMKPLDTLSTEILAKIYRGSVVEVGGKKLSSNQVILGMMIKPDLYRDIKIIRTKNKNINKMLGIDEKSNYASFSDFFEDSTKMTGYKLAQAVENATRKEAKHRDKLDKAILKVDERINICYMVYTGSLIKIWPKPNDLNNKWFATIEALQTFDKDEAEKLRDIAVEYFSSIDNSLKTGDWSEANSAIDKIIKYQKFYGSEVYPSENRIFAEVFYNKTKIFERLYPFYLLVGMILLILSFFKILKPKFNITIYTKISLVLLGIFFIAHTIGLANRWYISGHAPWSDGYESMIYIGWATILAGFIFSKKSSMTLASTSILAGLILFVAHLNWMDPQVTNLVPVLNSYWLSIHVSMITASYGFLGLGSLLGFVTVLLFIFKTEKNKYQITNSIKELNSINEMSLMVGLVLLTIGNFLGGVWANESWGRYWGWDPKETWALVTILIYAIVVHIRFIKSLYSEFNFAVISLLSYTSVIMTYFGVNYYLAGLHSYAKGDSVPVPDFVPISYTILFIVIALAYRNRKIV